MYSNQSKPYGMDPIHQSPFLHSGMNEILNNPQLLFTTAFKSTGVVENVAHVICEDHFIFDAVRSTLGLVSTKDNLSYCREDKPLMMGRALRLYAGWTISRATQLTLRGTS